MGKHYDFCCIRKRCVIYTRFAVTVRKAMLLLICQLRHSHLLTGAVELSTELHKPQILCICEPLTKYSADEDKRIYGNCDGNFVTNE